MLFQARQGDVLVQQVPNRRRTGRSVSERGRVILAHGELTGHAHEVIAAVPDVDDHPAAQIFEEPDGARFLFVERACLLIHEEHRPIAVPPGCFRVITQREYRPEGIRDVLD